MIKKAGTVPVTHFTVIKNTKEGMKEQLEQYLAEGVEHVLALRGDIPLGETTTCGDFNYATESCEVHPSSLATSLRLRLRDRRKAISPAAAWSLT